MDTTGAAPPVAVVGAGLSGLLAARRLAQAGLRVVVLEAEDRPGGQVRTAEVAGRRLDVGAEAMHLGAPQVGALVDELGLRESMVVAERTTSWLWTPRGLRPLPAGVGPAGPTRLRPVLSSRVMSVAGLVRAGLEPVTARRRGGIDLRPGSDLSVGEFVSDRFGRQVTDRLVDPLLGSLHAGDVGTLSLRACAPSLVPAATEGRSLVRGRRRGPAGASGAAAALSFVSWPGGLGTVVDRLLDGVAVEVRPGERVTALERLPGDGGARYRVRTDGGDGLDVSGVVLAIPARHAAVLLRGTSAEGAAAAAAIAGVRAASVATVLLGYLPDEVEGLPALRGTGVLVPSAERSLLKAATFLSTKWPFARPTRPGDLFWVRLSAGRAGSDAVAEHDDADLVAALRADLHRFTRLAAHPEHAHVERWPEAMPQLTVGHPDRMANARAALAALPGVALAGASYDGIGLASCITSAAAAAALVAGAVQPQIAPAPRESSRQQR